MLFIIRASGTHRPRGVTMKIRKGLYVSLLSLIVMTMFLLVPARPFAQEEQTIKEKLFQENYQLIADSDLYCSFYMLEEGKPLPDLRIIGAERMNEKNQFSDADTIYLSKGQ